MTMMKMKLKMDLNAFVVSELLQVNIKLLKEGMEIEARHVRRKQLSQYLDKELLNRERKNNEPSLLTLLAAKKRLSSELNTSATKKGRVSESVSIFFLYFI